MGFNVVETAQLLGVCRQTVYNLVHSDKLGAKRITNRMMIVGKENIDFLKRFSSLNNGPSHDTINRVFRTLNPRPFEECFVNRAQGFKNECVKERTTAIDGKTVRGSRDGFHGESPPHSIRAWSVKNGIRCVALAFFAVKIGATELLLLETIPSEVYINPIA